MARVIGGVEYVTTSEICRRLAPDVGPDTVRGWWRTALIHPLLGADTVAVRVPTGRRGGGEYLFAWHDVVEAERLTRGRGRARSNPGVPQTRRAEAGQADVYR